MSFRLIPIAFAQDSCSPGTGGFDLGNCLKLTDSSTVSSVYSNPAFLVNLIVRNMFVFAGVIFFLMFILAGYKFIVKGKEGIQDAQKILLASSLGFGIMFAAYWIVQLVSLLTGVNIPGIIVGN